MPKLLIVHHTVSPSMHALFEAVASGARDDAIEGVDVSTVGALGASVADVLAADGYLLGTPANLGYMSGALKDFFDRVYYPCLEETRGRPYGVYVHGNEDTASAVDAVGRIATGLGWSLVQAPVEVMAGPGERDLDACRELGAALAAGLTL